MVSGSLTGKETKYRSRHPDGAPRGSDNQGSGKNRANFTREPSMLYDPPVLSGKPCLRAPRGRRAKRSAPPDSPPRSRGPDARGRPTLPAVPEMFLQLLVFRRHPQGRGDIPDKGANFQVNRLQGPVLLLEFFELLQSQQRNMFQLGLLTRRNMEVPLKPQGPSAMGRGEQGYLYGRIPQEPGIFFLQIFQPFFQVADPGLGLFALRVGAQSLLGFPQDLPQFQVFPSTARICFWRR
jgi:hypothetical protein